MQTQRLSLSSSVFAGRIRRYDTMPTHTNRAIQRAPFTQQKIQQTQPARVQRSVQMVPKQNQTVVRSNLRLQVPSLQKTTTKSILTDQSMAVSSSLALQAVSQTPALAGALLADQFADGPLEKQLTRHRSKLHRLVYAFSIVVLVFASAASIQTILTNKETKDQLGVLSEQTTKDEYGVSEGTGSEPSEEVPSAQAISNYRVDPEAPRYIRIPSLSVFSRIKSLGIDKNGAVDAPANIHDAGWYNGSVRPGSDAGSSLIVGHVSGWTAPGVFKKLEKMQVGQRIEIEKGSGEKIIYEVTRTEKIPVGEVNMGEILGTEVAGEHDIKLMTCAGKYDKASDSYLDRFVVYAKELK